MPSFLCTCGEQLRYGEIPCPIEWLLISDVEYDKFAGSVDAEDVYRQMKHGFVCPRCRRLWVFWKGFSKEPTEYVPQTPG